MGDDQARISPAEAHAKMKDDAFAYVDVRTEDEFKAGHPEGAFNVPVMLAGPSGMTPNPDFVAVMERVFAKDAPIIVGCKSSGRSARAAKALVAAGFANILEQRAGWDGTRGTFGEIVEPGWSRASLPTETGAPEGRSYAALRGADRGRDGATK
jgi:rhodanese-related sulfurtransferase